MINKLIVVFFVWIATGVIFHLTKSYMTFSKARKLNPLLAKVIDKKLYDLICYDGPIRYDDFDKSDSMKSITDKIDESIGRKAFVRNCIVNLVIWPVDLAAFSARCDEAYEIVKNELESENLRV